MKFLLQCILFVLDSILIDIYGYRVLIGGLYEKWSIDLNNRDTYWFRVKKHSKEINASKPNPCCCGIPCFENHPIKKWTKLFPIIDNTTAYFEKQCKE